MDYQQIKDYEVIKEDVEKFVEEICESLYKNSYDDRDLRESINRNTLQLTEIDKSLMAIVDAINDLKYTLKENNSVAQELIEESHKKFNELKTL
jgi:hypothetical protein